MLGFFAKLILSLFLDEEGRRALARREHVSHLDDELKIEMAKTNALIASLNKQGNQKFGVSDERQAKISKALESQSHIAQPPGQ